MYEWFWEIFAKKTKFHDAGGPTTVVSPATKSYCQTLLTSLHQVADHLYRDLQVCAGAPLLPGGDLGPEEDIPESDPCDHIPSAGPCIKLRSLLQEPLLQLSRLGPEFHFTSPRPTFCVHSRVFKKTPWVFLRLYWFLRGHLPALVPRSALEASLGKPVPSLTVFLPRQQLHCGPLLLWFNIQVSRLKGYIG